MIIAEGTVKEIAQQTGLAVNTIKFYARPTYERRCKSNNHKILVPLDVYSIGS
jgi:DNA-binding NarL/FixJ family response regulator